MKDKFKIISIVLFLTFLLLYAWDLFLYNKYGGIGRYQAQTALGRGIIDTKTGHIFMPGHPQAVSDAENWYYIDPIRLEDKGYHSRLATKAKDLGQAGFTQKEIHDFLSLHLSRRVGLEGPKSVTWKDSGLTRKEYIEALILDSKYQYEVKPGMVGPEK
jgi:hypothetical protein